MEYNSDIYEFGKWAETSILKILGETFVFRELKQTNDKYCAIDGIMFHDNKLVPIQVKAQSPRILYKDVSIKASQYKNYMSIVDKNGMYICFLICSMYNPALGFDYVVHMFDYSKIKSSTQSTVYKSVEESVFFKLNQMKELDILPIEFQKELEIKHIELVRPHIDEKYRNAFKNKF